LSFAELLTHDELHWFNAYHQETREALMPLIHDRDVKRGWRMQRCRWNSR
jgi:Xaa-Pro aminopeptidase